MNARAGYKRCAKCGRTLLLSAFATPRFRECGECSIIGILTPAVAVHIGLTRLRERHRQRQRAREKRQVVSKPRGVTDALGDTKKCRRCGEVKPITAFAHPKFRVCASCDKGESDLPRRIKHNHKHSRQE